jgi:hypothetical protein
MDDSEFEQDPMMPPDWFVWDTAGGKDWHARPPGKPNPATYIHGKSKQEVADAAWLEHRRRVDAGMA